MTHLPVLLDEAIQALAIRPDGIYVDVTFGRGGHSRAILAKLGEAGRLIAFDQDESAAKEAASIQDSRFSFFHRNFEQLEHALLGQKVDGILADLGVSSPQLDEAERGFSFLRDGPLDMRMDATQGQTAAMWLSSVSEQDLADVLWRFGEERHSRRIAKAIVVARQAAPIQTTHQLAQIIKTAHPKWKHDKHPATQSFQAIRIFLNAELQVLERFLPQALQALKPNGRLVVMSFHSLEDRIVKHFFKDVTAGKSLPKEVVITVHDFPKKAHLIAKIKPSQEECQKNPRARSVVMRVLEKRE